MNRSSETSITEADYAHLTRACDRLIVRPGAPRLMRVLPWLHVINEVPFVLSAYWDVFLKENRNRHSPTFDPMISGRTAQRYSLFHFAQFIKCFIRSFYYRDSHRITGTEPDKPFFSDLAPVQVDVLIVTWLLNRGQLAAPEDFYFGEMQKQFQKKGMTSLLLMRNQSGYHSPELQKRALRKGRCARLLLPDTQSNRAEMEYIREGLGLRRYLKDTLRREKSELTKRIMKKASTFAILSQGLQNLRLHDQVAHVCRRVTPAVVITLYEGHAWERCVWHAARTVNPETLCVGYQHTILRKQAHAVKRALSPELNGFDPDLVLTIGDVTDKMLRQSPRLKGLKTRVYGSHRKSEPAVAVTAPKKNPVCLVLPEGVVSESIYLFELALACARVLTNFRFIFRTHPVLPIEQVEPLLKDYPAVNGNVEISTGKSIELDFAQSGYILYRGSSTVIYAILSGLKPFYYERPGEINFDPVYELSVWRESVRSVTELTEGIQKDVGASETTRTRTWAAAADYCDRYVKQPDADALMELAAWRGRAHFQNQT
jgi:hypothetical protein